MQLIYYPDPILKKVARPLERIDAEVREKIREMFSIMYEERGIGLAAPQVGWGVRLFIVNTAGTAGEGEELVYINPVITEREGEVIDEEGCLSLPEIRGKVRRNEKVSVRAQDLSGDTFTQESDDHLHTRVIQHELDHLDGILFIQLLSAADRLLIKSSLKKLADQQGRGAPSTR